MTATLPDITRLREDFPILSSRVHGQPLAYLDNAATTHKPRPVLDRLLDFYVGSNSNVHRGVHHLSEQASDAFEAARATVQHFINSPHPHEIIFTTGTTDGINLIARCFADQLLNAGDEIVVTELEHHSNLLPWQAACRQTGAALKIVPFEDDGSLHVAALQAQLTDRTRLVACSHVSNVLGIINPAREIIAAARAHNIPVLLDAAQSVPHLPIDVQQLDCDFLAFSGHKIYAPTGIGVLYAKADWLERLRPARFGGGMVSAVSRDETTFAQLPFKHEAGTPNVAGAVSLAAAIDYLESTGLEAIQQHENDLIQHALRQLTSIDDLTIYGTASPKCSAITFNLADLNAYDVAMILDRLGIAVRSGTHCAEPVMQHYNVTSAVRASFAAYNTTEEVDRLVAGLHKARDMLT